MPSDFVTESIRMAEAFGLLAVVSLPIGAAGWWLARPLSARWKTAGETWAGFEVLALFGLHVLLASLTLAVLSGSGAFESIYGPDFPPSASHVEASGAVAGGAVVAVDAGRSAEADQLRLLWAMLFAVPLLAASAVGIWALGRNRLPVVEFAALPGGVALGIAAWVVLTPIVMGVHSLSSWVADELGTTPEEHPLTRIPLNGAGPVAVLFGVVVCGMTPLAEELLFRGVLLGWVARRKVRPFVAMAAGVAFAAAQGKSMIAWYMPGGPVTFGLVLLLGFPLVTRFSRAKRTTAAVYSTAAAFALAHSSVWPTPVPLFVLGLGLGYLAARTRDITSSVVAHGLFNAVSFVYLLRGGAGV